MAKCPAFMERYRTQVSVDKYFYNLLLTTFLKSTLLIRLSKKKFIDETADSKYRYLENKSYQTNNTLRFSCSYNTCTIEFQKPKSRH